MTGKLEPSVWLSSSDEDSVLAERCSRSLAAHGIHVLSLQQVMAGDEVEASRAKAISRAAGVIVLLSQVWSDRVWPHEGRLIMERCERDGLIWVVDVAAVICPRELEQRLVPPRAGHRFPRAGKPIGQLVRAGQDAVLDELRRSVAAQLGLPAPQDAQYRHLQEYRKSQLENLKDMPLRGYFGAQHPSSARTFALTDLFVPPRLIWLCLPATITKQFEELRERIADASLSPEERWALESEQASLITQYKTGTPLLLEDALQRFPQVMLLGKPGSGKSSILQYLALQANKTDSQLAVQIKLHEIANKARFGASLWRQVRQKIQSQHSPEIAAAFEEWTHQGRALLLLDGVDEVPQEARIRLLRAIEDMLIERPRLRCVVTSRLASDCWLHDRIPRFQVADFDQNEISSFVRQHKHCESSTSAAAHSERLLQALSANYELGLLAHNPLSLRLLCLLDRGSAGLPMHLAELYERAIRTLLETWPPTRRAQKAKVPLNALHHALASVAAWMHDRGQREVSRSDLQAQLATYLGQTKPRAASELAAYCLEAATNQAGILIEISQDRFEFLHLTFAEYLAAEHHIRMGHLTRLAAKRAEGRYAQVIRFIAGILIHVRPSAESAAKFMHQLMTEPPGTLDQIQHTILPLAAACIGDGTACSAELVDDLLCAQLRAATIPLHSSADSIEQTLRTVAVPASAKVIDACEALLYHPKRSVRQAVALFVSRNTVRLASAQRLCQRFLSDWDEVTVSHAALGLLRAGTVPENALDQFISGLSSCFHRDIAAADEVETALRREPKLTTTVWELYRNPNRQLRSNAARLLSLLHPDKWELLSVLLEDSGEKNQQALVRAARHSESSALRLVDSFLAEVKPATHPRPAAEAVLFTIFADSTAVRERLIFHFCLPLPDADQPPIYMSTEHFHTKTAVEFLTGVARSGDDRQRSRDALLRELLCRVQDADPELCRRIAELGLAVCAPTSWLTLPLSRCIQAGGAFRVWATEVAFQQNLDSLAVAGVLARARTPNCLAAAVGDFQSRMNRYGSEQRILSALEGQSTDELSRNILQLCRVRARKDNAETLYPLLDPAQDSVPLPLVYWAANLLVLEVHRTKKQPPEMYLGAILASASASWPEPSDLTVKTASGQNSPSWVPIRDAFRETIPWEGVVRLPVPETAESATLLRDILVWLRKFATASATLSASSSKVESRWLRRVVVADLSLLDELIPELAHQKRARKSATKWLVLSLGDRRLTTRRGQASERPDDAESYKLILDHTYRIVTAAPISLRWELLDFLYTHGLGADRLPVLLIPFMSPKHPLSVRWDAYCRIRRHHLIRDATGKEVLLDALASSDLEFRLKAVEWAIEEAVTDLNCTQALRPLLDPCSLPRHQLQAAALWLRLPGTTRADVTPVLLRLLGHTTDLLGSGINQVCAALRHIIGPPPLGEPLPFPFSRFEPANERMGVGFWAAALLIELGDHGEALRSAIITWLDALPAEHIDDELARGWQDTSFRILEYIGVGEAGSAVDRVLLEMLRQEENHPSSAFLWIQKYRRLSQATLERLVPYIVRAEYDLDLRIAEWVLEFARQDSNVHKDLGAALLLLVRENSLFAQNYRWNLLDLLFERSLIDDDVADFFVQSACKQYPFGARENIVADHPAAHPIIQKHLISALGSHEAADCIRLIDWLMPIDELVREDRLPVAPPSLEVLDALRAWLEHPEYILRIEAAERLYRLGCHDEALVALRSCLTVPLEQVGLSYGDYVRKVAAKLLWKFGALSNLGLLDQLRPMLTSRHPFEAIETTNELLKDAEECQDLLREILREVLPTLPGVSDAYWPALELLLHIGVPEQEEVALLLRFISESPRHLDAAVAALQKLSSACPVTATNGGRANTAEDGLSKKKTRLQRGAIEGAARLADLPHWPPLLLRNFAAAVARPEDDLWLLETTGDSLDQGQAVMLLEPLLHHLPGDGAQQRLVRYACLLRFGRLVEITLDQVAGG